MEDLEQLIKQKQLLLTQMEALDELQQGLEHIDRYNYDNIYEDRIEVISRLYDPYTEEITDFTVSEDINKLYDDLSIVTEKINNLKSKE